MEFLHAAKGSFPLLHDRWGWKSKHYIDLAIDEVQELLDRLEELEAARPTSPTLPDGRGVLVMNAQPLAPALTAQRRARAALPGNGKGL
jgi:hypothetical protein